MKSAGVKATAAAEGDVCGEEWIDVHSRAFAEMR